MKAALDAFALALLVGLMLVSCEQPECHSDAECAHAFPGTNGDPE